MDEIFNMEGMPADVPQREEITPEMRMMALEKFRSQMQANQPQMQDTYSPRETARRDADFNRNAGAAVQNRIDPEAVPGSPTTGRMEDNVEVTKPMFPLGSDQNVISAQDYMRNKESYDPAEEMVRRLIHNPPRFR